MRCARLEWWAYPGLIEVGERSEVIADSAAQRCPVSVFGDVFGCVLGDARSDT